MSHIDEIITLIRTRREALGWGPYELARKAGLHPGTARDIDKADWNPTAATLRALEAVLFSSSVEREPAQ